MNKLAGREIRRAKPSQKSTPRPKPTLNHPVYGKIPIKFFGTNAEGAILRILETNPGSYVLSWLGASRLNPITDQYPVKKPPLPVQWGKIHIIGFHVIPFVLALFYPGLAYATTTLLAVTAPSFDFQPPTFLLLAPLAIMMLGAPFAQVSRGNGRPEAGRSHQPLTENPQLTELSPQKPRTFLFRHSRESGNPGLVGIWTPAFAGVTNQLRNPGLTLQELTAEKARSNPQIWKKYHFSQTIGKGQSTSGNKKTGLRIKHRWVGLSKALISRLATIGLVLLTPGTAWAWDGANSFSSWFSNPWAVVFLIIGFGSLATWVFKLLKGKDLSQQLIDAAEAGDIKTVKSLLKQGADPNAKDNNGRTALIWAVRHGYTETIQLLLDKGADPNAK
ncbi:MAG: ankyrin repeat domain-containing protein, partial [Elusimicrobiota bacterium]